MGVNGFNATLERQPGDAVRMYHFLFLVFTGFYKPMGKENGQKKQNVRCVSSITMPPKYI